MSGEEALRRKQALVDELQQRLRAELDNVVNAQRETVAGATHEEAKPENDKDTRALESTYLARGLAQRVTQLREGVAKLDSMAARDLGEDPAAVMGALVTVEDEDARTERYFVAPAGGGLELGGEGSRVKVVTPASPLGRCLLGRRAGEEVDLQRPQGVRTLELIDVI